MPIGLVGAGTRYTVISRVTVPAASRDLVSLETIKEELDLSGTDANRDARLTRYIKEQSRAAENYCNRVFAVETIEDTFFPRRDPPLVVALEGLDPLQLAKYPLVAISTLTENGADLTSGTDYLVDLVNAQVTRLDMNGYPRRWDALPIVVTYTAGYSAVPDDVSAAVIRMVAQRYFANIRDPWVKSEVVEGIGRTDYIVPSGDTGNMTADVADLLDNYRVPVVA